MTSKNSNSLKCRQCGIINWATDQYCRRCHQPLAGPSAAIGADGSPNRFNLYLMIFIAALALPVLVSLADPMLGDHLGSFLVIGAIGLIISFKFLIIYEMFKVSIMWGAAGIIFAPVSTLLFIGSYWERAKGKVFLMLAAILYIVIMIAGVGLLTKPKVAQNTTAQPSAPSTKPVDQMPASKPIFLPPSKNEPVKKTPVKK